jgi:hypothetical protein
LIHEKGNKIIGRLKDNSGNECSFVLEKEETKTFPRITSAKKPASEPIQIVSESVVASADALLRQEEVGIHAEHY